MGFAENQVVGGGLAYAGSRATTGTAVERSTAFHSVSNAKDSVAKARVEVDELVARLQKFAEHLIGSWPHEVERGGRAGPDRAQIEPKQPTVFGALDQDAQAIEEQVGELLRLVNLGREALNALERHIP